MRYYTHVQVLAMLRREVKKAGSPFALSKRIGCTFSRVYDALNGKSLNPAILRYLGLAKVTVYQRKSEPKV